jgi:hypothetical protein
MVEQVREIRDLIGEIESREFHELIDRMQQSLRDLDRQELQRAMREMKLSQEEIAQALDRTLQMLRRLLAVEKLDELLQRITALEMRQAEINHQLETGDAPRPDDRAEAGEEAPGPQPMAEEPEDPNDPRPGPPQNEGIDTERPLTPEESAELAAEQERIRRELEALREALAQLQDASGESLEQLSRALEEYRRQSQIEETRKQMQQAQQAMSECSRSSALKFGRKARQGLEQMQSGMMSLKQQFSAAEAEALARALYEIAHRMVRASQVQEDLAGRAGQLSPRALAVREQELYEEVGSISDSLLAVARKSTVVTRRHLRALGDVMTDIATARDQLAAGRRPTAVALTAESSRKLNAATKALLEAAMHARGMCSSNCPNPFNQMQSLSGQQQSLNEDTQQLLGACQMPRLSSSQQESMMRLAARQEMIRQGLSEIREELETSGKLMGEIGDVIDEMEEVTRELRRRQADRRIVERQERILSRLLSAQRSLRRQDETEERQSRTGVDPGPRHSPPPVEMGRTPAERLRRSMLRGSQDPVPAEYRRIVEIYMQQLMREP